LNLFVVTRHNLLQKKYTSYKFTEYIGITDHQYNSSLQKLH